MRFSIAALFFVCLSFVFFVLWAIFSFMIDTVHDVLLPSSPAGFVADLNLLPVAFGVMCAVFFVTSLILVFVLDSLADEPEMYWRQ